LEGLAEPGGICISEDAYRQVQNKVSAEFSDIGEQQLKNIARPVRAYRIIPGERGSLARSSTVAVPPLSIVVLPFINIGGSQEQEYFVDGVTESLTTDLSRIPDSFVIARNTAFTFKGRPVDVKQIGRELGINYVVEGSVQRASNRLRLNVQLIDARVGSHLWAERFDSEQTDLFQMQDEIVGRLARTLDVELTAIIAQAGKSYSENPVSIDYIFRGRAALNRGLTADAQADALHHFEQVTAMVAKATEKWGSVDLLCANAGILRDKSFAKMEVADFAKVLDVHLTGTFYCCKAVWDGMRERNYGRIVVTTSSSGLFGNFGQANYGAA